MRMGAKGSQGNRFANFRAPPTVVQHLVQKSQPVGQVEPEPAVETARVETAAEKRVMPLHHHVSVAFETLHGLSVLSRVRRNPRPFVVVPRV